jgi:hypothetical protein
MKPIDIPSFERLVWIDKAAERNVCLGFGVFFDDAYAVNRHYVRGHDVAYVVTHYV